MQTIRRNTTIDVVPTIEILPEWIRQLMTDKMERCLKAEEEEAQEVSKEKNTCDAPTLTCP